MPDRTRSDRASGRWSLNYRVLGPVRSILRLAALVGWTLGCYVVLRAVSVVLLPWKPRARKVRYAVSYAWASAFLRIVGTRLIQHGDVPPRPFFVTINHPSWLDMFIIIRVLRPTFVGEEPVSRVPILGTLVKGLEPIFVRRVKEDTARVNDAMVKAIEADESLLLAPKAPLTLHTPGKEVHQFRAGLLESAVRTQTPVHGMSITYRTPPGCPPPTKSMLFGPNPFIRTPEGQIPESEIKAWGPPRSFLWFLLCELALPWNEVVVNIAAEPVIADDRITLANQLHDVVAEMFTPME